MTRDSLRIRRIRAPDEPELQESEFQTKDRHLTAELTITIAYIS